jgi:hypothetical protein
MTSKPERTAFYNITILIKILLRGKNNYYIFTKMAVAKSFGSFYVAGRDWRSRRQKIPKGKFLPRD